jgi:hypothetical protein
MAMSNPPVYPFVRQGALQRAEEATNARPAYHKGKRVEWLAERRFSQYRLIARLVKMNLFGRF